MDRFKRYGIYAVPEGAFYRAGAEWLGWDSVAGAQVVQPQLDGLPNAPADLAATPRKYGFHGTIKPPFRLADGTDAHTLAEAAAHFCAARAPVVIPRLEVRRLGSFIAVVPAEPNPALAELAGAAVKTLDAFRAPPTEAEVAKRRQSHLSPRQEANLDRWGYPYVMEEFRFHLTLTGRLPGADADTACAVLKAHLAPHLPHPFVLGSLCLMGEDAAGMFHLIRRYTLAG